VRNSLPGEYTREKGATPKTVPDFFSPQTTQILSDGYK
jgi:hypothetical protein